MDGGGEERGEKREKTRQKSNDHGGSNPFSDEDSWMTYDEVKDLEQLGAYLEAHPLLRP